MPNELSKKVYPDGTEVTYKDTVAREQIAGITDVVDVTKLGYLNNVTSDVQAQITGLDTRVTTLEGGGVFEMITNDRVNTPQAEETKTLTVMYRGAGLFNAVNADIKYLWFALIADDSYTAVNLPGPICIPYALFSDQKTFFSYRNGKCDVEIRRGESDNKIVWNWVFETADLPTGAYRYRIYVAK